VKIGERVHNLKRPFNIGCGTTAKDDTLPKRFPEEPLPDGGCKGEVVELDKMLAEYYQLRGWNENGIPKKEKLESLGLNDVERSLWK